MGQRYGLAKVLESGSALAGAARPGLAAVVAVLIAAMVVDETNAGGFGAQQAWLYVTLLTVGYMLSRGLAKSGSRDPYTEDRDH